MVPVKDPVHIPDAQWLALKSAVGALAIRPPPTARVVAQCVGHALLAWGGLAGMVLAGPLWIRGVGLLASVFGFVGFGTLGHSAAHNALFASSRANRVFFLFCYPLMLQVSACYWRHSHNTVHHPAPNLVGVDLDCDLRPVFALNQEHLASMGGWRARWPWLQGVLLPLTLPFNGFNIVRQAWTRLWTELLNPERRGAEPWLDLACLTAHVTLFLVLPCLVFRPVDVVTAYLLRVALIGIGLTAILAPAHFPEEAACLPLDQRRAGGFVSRQCVATLNFRTGPVGRFLCSGLEYQIEHHLFPSVSHLHHPALQPVVEAFCRQHGIPYRTLGWGEALWKSWRVFFVPKPVRRLEDAATQARSTLNAAGRDANAKTATVASVA